jgi:hypothetical protein
MRRVLIISILSLSLTGCVSMVKDIITAPIVIVSKTADVLTTSQSESDEKRGRQARKKEEQLGKIARKLDKARDKCEDGNADACEQVKILESQYDDAKYS